jgi:hypothetical protein
MLCDIKEEPAGRDGQNHLTSYLAGARWRILDMTKIMTFRFTFSARVWLLIEGVESFLACFRFAFFLLLATK